MQNISTMPVHNALPVWRKTVGELMDAGILFAFALCGLIIALAPKGLSLIVVIIALCACGHACALSYRVKMPVNSISISLLAVLGWIGLSIFWVEDTHQAIERLWKLYAAALSVPFIWSYMSHADAVQKRKLKILFWWNLGLASFIATFIVFFHDVFRDFVYSLGFVVNNDDQHLRGQMGTWASVSNRSLSALAMLGLLGLSQITFARKWVMWTMLPLCFGIVWSSQSQSVLMTYIVLVGFYALTKYFFRISRSVLLAGFILGGLLIVPASEYNYQNHLAENILPEPFSSDASLGVRVPLYASYAAEVWQRPLWGRGIGQSAYYPVSHLDNAALGDYLTDGRAPHPHNLFLQIWFEFGAVGMLLFGFFLCQLVRHIGTAGSIPNRTALATLLTCLAAPFFAFSLWQSWLLCLWVLVFAVFLLFFQAPNETAATT